MENDLSRPSRAHRSRDSGRRKATCGSGTGLLSYPLDPAAARAHLATSVSLQMALKPHIIHVVGHTEADHAPNADDVIASCGIARRAIENALRGVPDMISDPAVGERAYALAAEAQITLKAIRSLVGKKVADPLTEPAILAQAVASGILDAPQLRNNPFAKSQIVTRIIKGGCDAVGQDRTS